MKETSFIRRVFVEKRPGFCVEADEMLKDLKQNLGKSKLRKLRILNRYDVNALNDEEFKRAITNVFTEPVVDDYYLEKVDLSDADYVFAIESLPGQYNQRADSTSQCIQILTQKSRPDCLVAQVIALYGDISQKDYLDIKDYLINPVESRQASLDKPDSLVQETKDPERVKSIEKFTEMTIENLNNLMSSMGLAMSLDDLIFVQKYFVSENRNPTITEIRVLDTYWSDHCRHTTFLTKIDSVDFAEGDISNEIGNVYNKYVDNRNDIYKERISQKPICLMDIATLAMKELKKSGKLDDLDESEEINACSIKVPVLIDGIEQDYLVMFKNETHNHPTEIEPFGGAATCLGGAIRDPLSGRSYVYQAMRVTGSGDPTVPVSETMPGKLSQRKITTKAANGYSSYGNQIGLATGLVEEIYHPGYLAKRMEIGAVIASAPSKNVVRERPNAGDCIILLGGRTGRDGCGGATGSSKEHDEESIFTCGSEVQKGNPPTERKIQRLFRNEKVSQMIKRCNDFGAGGVCVAIGELADGLVIDLDKVLKKYEGLDGTEIAISESQERMAVVIDPENEEEFLNQALAENLEAVTVAKVTKEPVMIMNWQNDTILQLKREFIDSNGAPSNISIKVTEPESGDDFFSKMPITYKQNDFKYSLIDALNSLACCSRKGLVEKFDSSIGANTVLMPFGGRTKSSPEIGMAAKIPVLTGETEVSTVMTFGFDPYISEWSPFHGAYYAVLESLAKVAAMGADPFKSRLTFQEYFEKLGDDPKKWGKPFSALLGAYKAQLDFQTPAIGGKDSMSGTFKDLTVPPTLVSFAVSTANAKDIISATFAKTNSAVVCLPVVRDVNNLPKAEIVKEQYNFIKELRSKNIVLSASTVREGGIAVAITKMSFGNEIGFKFDKSLSQEDLFKPNTASIILELDLDTISLKEINNYDLLLSENGFIKLGETKSHKNIEFAEQIISIVECKTSWEGKLEDVFPTKSKIKDNSNYKIDTKPNSTERIKSQVKIAKPRVFIPVFPGTNCEYDTIKAFENSGAVVNSVIFKNLTSKDIEQSIEQMKNAIVNSNIIMIPGGFSGGDEPDGSGKFIAAAFKNPYLTEEIYNLLYKRDGLMLGICNGFQALIKLGLLPYGKISELDETSPTLTFNKIGRHVSDYVRTKIITNSSPWLSMTKPGDIHLIPVSHGEGRFVANEDMIKALNENGQIATLYVDLDGNPSYETPFNPNGSAFAIEGITALDGRIFGKMGHSERIGNSVAKNIIGNKDQKIFDAGVNYFA